MVGEISSRTKDLCIDIETNKSFREKISILVVDDDGTCLSIISSFLRKWKYRVVAIKDPEHVLPVLRSKCKWFDLILLDVHMPKMNGFELQSKIKQLYDIPIVLMSADDKERVVLYGLKNGAVFFMLKPVVVEGLRNLWMYAYMGSSKNARPGKSIAEESDKNINIDIELLESSEPFSKVYHKRKSISVEGNGRCDHKNVKPTAVEKKAKRVWTPQLHNRFMEAFAILEIQERAVPKSITELMNVPGLTREQVASHLQKFRKCLQVLDGNVDYAQFIRSFNGRNNSLANFIREICNPPNNFEQQQKSPFSLAQIVGQPNIPAIGSSNLSGGSGGLAGETNTNLEYEPMGHQAQNFWLSNIGGSTNNNNASSSTNHGAAGNAPSSRNLYMDQEPRNVGQQSNISFDGINIHDQRLNEQVYPNMETSFGSNQVGHAPVIFGHYSSAGKMQQQVVVVDGGATTESSINKITQPAAHDYLSSCNGRHNLTQRDDEQFLASLFAPKPYGDDQTHHGNSAGQL